MFTRNFLLLVAFIGTACTNGAGQPAPDTGQPPSDGSTDAALNEDTGAAAADTASAEDRPVDPDTNRKADVGGVSCQVNFSIPSQPVDGGVVPAVAAGAGLPAHITGVFPAPGATEVCADAQLRIAFAGPTKAGKAGKILVWQTTGPDGGTPVVVDSLDLADGGYTKQVGGKSFFYWPVVFEGSVATIILHAPLPIGGTYAVTVDDGVFIDTAGAPLPGIADDSLWTFSTTTTAPSVKPALTVALDGTGDTCTIQGAIDLVPVGNTTPIEITLKAGTYREIVYAASKRFVTLRGEDREKSIIAYANNENCNKGTASRALVTLAASSDWVIENLTIANQAPLLSSNAQAEALHVEASRIIVRNANLFSNQDTLLLNGLVYIADSLIKGNVDYVWGTGTAYFERCELRTVARAGYTVQARNPATSYGYVFVDCKLTAESPNMTGHYLARTNFSDPSGAPACHVAFVNCQMGSHIDPKGWLVAVGSVDNSQVRFWEYQSTDPTGAPVDVSQRILESKQLDDASAAEMRDATVVLKGWNPRS